MRILLVTSVLLTGVFVVLFLVGLSSIGMFTYDTERDITPEELSLIPQLSRNGFSKAVINVSRDRINLISGCRRLVMITTSQQTLSIRRGLEGAMDYRPNSHDMLKNVMDVFEMKPIMVKINNMIEGTYFARLFVSQGNRVLDLDSRPSDAIAIAARSGIPVYVNMSLMEEHGEKVC